MKFNDIAIFSVSRIISERISTLLVEKDIDIQIYELEHYDVIDKAQELVNSGTKVIISRGGTAAVLRRCVNIPIVEIPHDFYGIYKTIEEAKRFGDKIVAIGFPQYCNMLKHYQSITHESFKICQVYNHKEIEDIMATIKNDGCHVVIGGLTVNQFAEKYDINVVMGDTDNLSIEVALNQAVNLIKYINQEKLKYNILDNSINLSSDSIISFDGSGIIINVNYQARKNFDCDVGDNIFRFKVFKTLHEYIISENNVKSHIVEYNNKNFDLSLSHIHSKENFFSILRIGVVKNSISMTRQNSHFPTRYSFVDILGSSEKIKECIFNAKKFAKTDFPVYIEGETGTGKELFAQSIHKDSLRSNKPFIALNCSAIPETLLESELFGYEEGVFTGAKKGGKVGIFELVDGGTIFLDEVSEISSLVQLKLLRVLQERAFSRVGGNALISTDFRLITASNKPLKEMVINDKFRRDFFYRLNILKLPVPNLHARENDVILLANQFVTLNGRELKFSDEAAQFMLNYEWPGNIRELQSLVYRLIVLCESDDVNLNDLIECGEYLDHGSFNHGLLESNELEIIKKVLSETHGDKVQAAKKLGISVTTLWRRMKKFKIHT
ncbi:sigma 54-interacting transcriptional regulator [Vibrio gazogenes]|uniref:Transcriptional regulator containing PAS, AAA-type ATPase, and DNA-binding Fis domains n=1 Tax=Vibrio gazogenes DSM 21264 = NBRC 103151 TaxID=1123492 RepID=A0A1M5C4T0_VIBGA|nr:sigma 54-interacting transcriptional regulator [Vibrio gazogenes]USP15369.1 sigma 54-interacting transcriptional regulator [Vibrio gazogenes]SHF49783.1 Transcriptional regulator containing PAS, AAA-type ATPase, and DNA-binding Fis domains [Vibrio gazogenes DSM 21264] [Vibrio gazogenes DSM 21264 = NBRC 103151]SJN55535.1 Propionate catabolism operon regulatory protein [Vibrio gazogenes]